MQNQTKKPINLLKLDAVAEKMQTCRSRIYQFMHEDGFPKPMKFGHASRWVESEIDAWLQARIDARDEVEA